MSVCAPTSPGLLWANAYSERGINLAWLCLMHDDGHAAEFENAATEERMAGVIILSPLSRLVSSESFKGLILKAVQLGLAVNDLCHQYNADVLDRLLNVPPEALSI
ncbi:hypothetical protein EVAR_34303_1 [Eumeta japonica]|uniref:Uncharacterized protein n=1 Tax=Eumeta variegata TaxID=151549 RepID=A0A4C1VZY8_EUMVA|nr:hypothetical protein EVAR_34303_1 [Eumeta japonica]